MSDHRRLFARRPAAVMVGLLLSGPTLLVGGFAAAATSTATTAAPTAARTAATTAAPVAASAAVTNTVAASAGTQNFVLPFGSAAAAVGDEANLTGPLTGIASTPDGNGYWATTASGQVINEGDAKSFGSVSSPLRAPIVGIAATPDGNGYWLVASDGGVFTFGDAQFFGSTGGMVLNKPVVGMTSTSDGNGYWLVASDGGVFTFGDAPFFGSMGGTTLAQPVVGITATPDNGGYRMVASDGGIFDFGDAGFYGSGTGAPLTAPVVGMASRPGGYWIAYGATAPLNTVLGQEEVLAELGYSPLSWSPAGFQWRWAPPATLQALWSPGQNGVIAQGAIMSFESVAGLSTDGAISTGEINALQAAANDSTGPDANPNGFSYAVANESSPESLTIWHNGVVVETTPANTGGAGTPTAKGSFPVYLRLRNQVMRGTNPDGSTYADPVQFVAYFNGGDALHYMPRTSYGDPQSLGCVELPLTAASIVWPYMNLGSIVTVD